MMRFKGQAEKTVRAASILITVITLTLLACIFFDSLFSCLLLVWKHTAQRVDVPVMGDRVITLVSGISFGVAVMAVYGMRKRLRCVFWGKTGKWYAVLAIPQLVLAAVIYVADLGASHGVLFRSGGDMGAYYDHIFSLAGWGVLSALSLFAVGVYVFGMDRIHLEQKKAEQYQVQVAVYKMLEEQYSQAERLRHDLKNHVLALRGLWEEQMWEKLGDYLKRMEGSAQLGANEEATGNRAVDALLRQKRKMAEEKGIDWECDVQIPKQSHINEFDLCVLFGNILDNAVEACGRLQREAHGQEGRPFIRVQAGAVKKCFLLVVKNSMNAAEKPTGGISERKNPQGQGIGLLNVRDVVREYNGVMNTEMQNGIFDISVLLPLGKAAYDMERVV
ncbi:MAG: GHKL domain-containing protein [Lachnospiraceae bacterium]|nr:GHKL domain-containing protein [Lachnospiraceae bacterium]